MMLLTLHGTGAGNPSAERGASAASVRLDDGAVLLLDAGENCSRAMLRHEVDIMRIGAVAISHSHPDHWAGLPNLALGWTSRERTEPVDLFLPLGSEEFFRSVIRNSWMNEGRIPFEIRYREIDDLISFGDLHIATFRTSHLDKRAEDAKILGLPFPAFGYVLSGDGWRVVMSQDVGSIDDLRDVVVGASLLVCEATHLEPREALCLAAEQGVPRVVFTHIPPDGADFPENEKPWADTVTWEIAYDGMRIPLR